MVLPSHRWFIGAALLGPLALVGISWPGALGLLLLLDVVWISLCLVDALLAGEPRGLDVERDAPPAFSVGRTLAVGYRWTHAEDRALSLQVREQMPAPLAGAGTSIRVLRLPPGRPTKEQLDIRPLQRGKGSGGRLTIRVLGPLGLAWWQGRLDRPWSATVYPELHSLVRALPAQVTRRREAGLRNIRRPGEGGMFEALREWVPGDDTRTIDWKATARRGKTMARQYEDERRQQVLLVIDAGRLLTVEVDGVARLEAVVDAALRLAYSAVENDDNIGLMVFADQIQQFVPPARGRRALRSVLEALASIEGRIVESDYPTAFAYLAARNRRRALTVVFTDVIDRTASEVLVAQTGSLRPRHLPLAVTLKNPALEAIATARPDSISQAFDRAASEELLTARQEALADMRARGVLVLDVWPKNAGDAVVAQYRKLKRRGLL